MWTRYNIRWEFLTDLCGSVPADPALVKKWLEARKPTVKPPQGKSIDDIAAEVAATTFAPEEEMEHSFLTFQRVNGGLANRAATIRAHLKDCATVLSSLYVGRVEKERSFAVKVKNALYWPPDCYWVPILNRDGQPVTEPTGTRDVPVHVMTRQGPINALKTLEYVSNAVMEFPLLILTPPSGKPVISEADLKTLMMYGGTHGYGGERSLDGGRYVFSIAQAGDE
jgi:hypothetical protein